MSFVNQASAVAIEQFANRLLQLDAEAQDKLSLFADKTIHIHIEDLKLNYFLLFPNASLVVQARSDRSPSASISGKVGAFLAAMASENSGDSIFTGDLHFTGEINTARKFQGFVQSLKIDWHEPFSQLLGDRAGHTVASGLQKIGELGKHFLTNLTQDFPEYLQEEARVTPTSSELNEYFEQVDLVRSQSDRLQARISRLNPHD